MRPGHPLVIALQSSEPVPFDARHAWMRPAAPARLDLPITDGARLVAHVEIEDVTRGAYPDSARARCERCASEYARALSELLFAQDASVPPSDGR